MGVHGLPPVSPTAFIVCKLHSVQAQNLGSGVNGERTVCRRQGVGGSGGMCSEQVAPNLSVWGGI